MVSLCQVDSGKPYVNDSRKPQIGELTKANTVRQSTRK